MLDTQPAPAMGPATFLPPYGNIPQSHPVTIEYPDGRSAKGTFALPPPGHRYPVVILPNGFQVRVFPGFVVTPEELAK